MNKVHKVQRELTTWVHERFLFRCVSTGDVMEFVGQGSVHVDIVKKAIALAEFHEVRVVEVGYNTSGNMFILFEGYE